MTNDISGPVHICSRYRYPMHLFSEQVLGTNAFRLRDHWIVLGTIAFRFVIGTIHGLRSLTSMHYTAQRENSLVGMIDRLTLGHNVRSPQLCTKPRPLEHILGTTAFRLRFGGVLRGWLVPRTWFDHVPAGTVLAGTVPARTRSDYKKWCVPRTCSSEHVPAGTVPRTSVNARIVPHFLISTILQRFCTRHDKLHLYKYKNLIWSLSPSQSMFY